MCGIFGMFSKECEVNPAVIKKALATLEHRGPDGQQYWISENYQVGLGHTRLSIIDLEGGTQPLQNEDGQIRAVVNGEIYDFERLRKELQAAGHHFATASDSEVLIHLYEDFGLDALHQLRGEYAFIIWDGRTGRLLAGRDRFGIKPLYYSNYQGRLYLASEIKAMLAAGVSARWDEESFYTALYLGSVPLPNRSFFQGVFQILPGHVMVATEEHQQLYQYWDFNYSESETNYHLTEAEAIESFREQFEEAVKLRLRADVPVGVYLSGGIDSCSILGTVAKFHGQGMKAFTLSFTDTAYDEVGVAREMAELTGAEFNPYYVTSSLLAENFLESVKYSESLVVNPHSVAKFLLSKAVREAGYKVVLTGEGSDEILGGYAHFRQDLLLYGLENASQEERLRLLKELKEKNAVSAGVVMIDEVAATSDSYNSVKRRLGMMPSWLETYRVTGEKFKLLLKDDFSKKYAAFNPYQSFLDQSSVHQQLSQVHVLNRSLYLWSKLFLPNYLLINLGDRMEMGHSVEGRVPFLDHKLVEFVTKLPVSFKIKEQTEKYILREAMRPVLSKTVYERQKHPFLAPPSIKEEDPMFTFIREYVGDHLQQLPFFEVQKLTKIVSNLKKMSLQERKQYDLALICLASIMALQEQFKMGV